MIQDRKVCLDVYYRKIWFISLLAGISSIEDATVIWVSGPTVAAQIVKGIMDGVGERK